GVVLTSVLGSLSSSSCLFSSSTEYKNSTFMEVPSFGFSPVLGFSGSLHSRRNAANTLTLFSSAFLSLLSCLTLHWTRYHVSYHTTSYVSGRNGSSFCPTTRRILE